MKKCGTIALGIKVQNKKFKKHKQAEHSNNKVGGILKKWYKEKGGIQRDAVRRMQKKNFINIIFFCETGNYLRRLKFIEKTYIMNNK